jgi:lipoprotein signal peptidase
LTNIGGGDHRHTQHLVGAQSNSVETIITGAVLDPFEDVRVQVSVWIFLNFSFPVCNFFDIFIPVHLGAGKYLR